MIRLEMNRKQEAILAAFIIVAALGTFALYAGLGRSPAAPADDPSSVQSIIAAEMERCSSVDDGFYAALDSGLYNQDNPLVVVDPYGTAPLTALVLFQTSEPIRISVNVAGRTENAGIGHTFGSFETSHYIPVYGLYPEALNLVEIIAEPLDAFDENGGQGTRSILLTIETQSVPGNYPDMLVSHFAGQGIRADAAAHPGSYFTFTGKSAFDSNGDCRWYYDGFDTLYPVRYTDYGTMLIIVGSFDMGDAQLVEADLLGRVIGVRAADMASDYGGRAANHAERRAMYPEY